MPAACPLVFTEPKPAHKALRDQIFGASAAQREARRQGVSIAPHIGFLSPETPAIRQQEDREGGSSSLSLYRSMEQEDISQNNGKVNYLQFQGVCFFLETVTFSIM
jgi:hypothetical protein